MKKAYWIACFISQTVSAADPFACVDSDIRLAFLDQNYLGNTVYSTEPLALSRELTVPQDLSLIGSKVAPESTTVVYKSKLDAKGAMKSAVSQISKAGWSPQLNDGFSGMKGFQMKQYPQTRWLCRDGSPGALAISTVTREASTLVSYILHSKVEVCASNSRMPMRNHIRDYYAEMPELSLPDDVTASNYGSGGSGNDFGTHVDLAGSMSRTELMSFFNDQIREQGWAFQTDWVSRYASGSVWARESEDRGLLIGSLQLIETSESTPVRVRFSFSPASEQAGPSMNFSSSSARVLSN